MSNNKKEWVKDIDEKCRKEFLDSFSVGEQSFWQLDSYIQVAKGLQMFNKESVGKYLDLQNNKEELLKMMQELHDSNVRSKKEKNKKVSHKKIIDSIHK